MTERRLKQAKSGAEKETAPGADEATPPPVENPDPTVDRRTDMAVAAGGAALGIVLIVASLDIHQGSVDDPIGSGGLAVVLGGFLVFGGLLLIGQRLWTWKRSGHQVPAEGAGDEFGQPASTVRPFVMWLAGLGWVFLLPRVGFIVSAYVLAVFGLFAMGVRTKIKLAVVPVVFAIVLWVLFNRVFGVQYPAGPVDLFFADLIPRMSF